MSWTLYDFGISYRETDDVRNVTKCVMLISLNTYDKLNKIISGFKRDTSNFFTRQ